MKLSDIGEFGLIRRIAERVTYGSQVAIGIGDDAAATVPTPGNVTLTTSDMLIEGVHFDLKYSDPFTLGKKSLSVNLSDIAAMGATPRYFLLSLAIPPAMTVETLDSFVAGLNERASEFGVSLVGGDTCASLSGFVISITLVGEQRSDLVVRRSGAKPGDLICVTGTLGDSALGLELLRRGERGSLVVERHLDPLPRMREGLLLAERGFATAMVDVSDGLVSDLGHIIAASKVGARIDAGALPLSTELIDHSGRLGLDRMALALAGGEDYELLFTIPREKQAALRELWLESAVPLTIIGEINDTGRLQVVGEGGMDVPVKRTGYNHFT